MEGEELGLAESPRIFASLTCPCDKVLTPHLQLRVLAYWTKHWRAEWQILVKCTKCKIEYVWHTNDIPSGMSAYHVRINANGRARPEIGLEESPSYSEEFTVLAKSRQGAYRQSQFASTMPLSGQVVETLIDGIEERDARF